MKRARVQKQPKRECTRERKRARALRKQETVRRRRAWQTTMIRVTTAPLAP